MQTNSRQPVQWNALLSRLINFIRLFGKRRHRRYIAQAARTLDMLSSIAQRYPAANDHRPRILGYLRKIDPLVFEELVLTAVERRNVMVSRNRRYTGDGGSDGVFHVPEGDVQVQCKRYGAAINPAHVRDFCALVVRERAAYGVFAHTGRTGDGSREAAQGSDRVCFVSGGLLVDVLLGRVDLAEHVRGKIVPGRRDVSLRGNPDAGMRPELTMSLKEKLNARRQAGQPPVVVNHDGQFLGD
ncbi:restriction endonuclease [Burkholderia pseudomallei]|uniref:restriction endonuclease n=1 Tax=Burkholderia pseudomallei TaxID=28450 RepID=UPI000975A8C2|nr:restriction endonuclease [Burkholderia pseudomallei]